MSRQSQPESVYVQTVPDGKSPCPDLRAFIRVSRPCNFERRTPPPLCVHFGLDISTLGLGPQPGQFPDTLTSVYFVVVSHATLRVASNPSFLLVRLRVGLLPFRRSLIARRSSSVLCFRFYEVGLHIVALFFLGLIYVSQFLSNNPDGRLGYQTECRDVQMTDINGHGGVVRSKLYCLKNE